MSDKDSKLNFEAQNPAEQKLWAALEDLPRGEPSNELRRKFYSELHEASKPGLFQRLGDWLGLGQGVGWVTAAACLVVGFGFAQIMQRGAAEDDRLQVLENNLALIQRELVLDRLQDGSPGTRLKGVVDAGEIAATDQQVAMALLDRAAQDQSTAVRAAAIDALGTQMNSDVIGEGVMALLQASDSPIVQLSLVDLVLRHGNAAQVRQLQQLADEGRLHPDLVRHVQGSLRSQSI